MISPQRAMWPSEVHTFWPLSTHTSPSRTAIVASPATSEPAPGSENSWHQMSSAVKIRRRYCSFCSGVPHSTIVGPHIP